MQIAFVLYPELTALDLVGPLEVLSRLPGAEVHLVATDPGTVTADNGVLQLVATSSLHGVPAPDVLLVPGGTAGTVRAARDPELLDWLRQAALTATWITSVCTGSLVLGSAGLLEGRRATSHWAALEELRAYGAEPVQGRFVVDGNVVTAAGVSAGIDMALWLTAQLAGGDVADLLELVIEYAPEPPRGTGSPDTADDVLVDLGREVIRSLMAAPATP
ncbi:DJ-1/PfpI family protein [Nitriliruptor alkaliphilus]|uniref:DJ-1/PfpI family protein n=1 Tax=Nitriliruptor alkaliphilus TaxID=427918 RepID=UPI000696A50E|nr:DJ-1/PfpI family protein [Nitriliruptor alkaliphilus]